MRIDPAVSGRHKAAIMQSLARVLARALRGGTPRNPGADLSRLPVGLDLRAIRLAEGLRAALACAVLLAAHEWLGWASLVYAALAAFLTCLCDAGGPVRLRALTLLSFPLAGAVLWGGFGLLRGAGLAVALPCACAAIFVTSFIRIWGVAATAAGNLLSVVIILALDRPLSWDAALVVGGMFAAGGLWATALTAVVWRLNPYRPARLAVAEVWRRMAALSGDLLSLVRREGVGPAEWDAHARAHRRAVREEIEYARTLVMDLVGLRGRLSPRGAQTLLRLEAGDQAFGALIALSGLLELSPNPARRNAAVIVLRLLCPALRVVARSMAADTPVRPAALERALATAAAAAASDPALARITATIADRLRIAARLATPDGFLPGGAASGEAAQPWWDRLRAPVLANLTWDSAMLRHSLRTVVVTAPALAVTQIWAGHIPGGRFAHWLPITVVVTLQPFYAATWQRTLERVGGTVLGGLAGAALAFVTRTPGLLAALMFPLCTIAFAARQVSFGAFIAGVTPIVVVLIELIEPGHNAWAVAAYRSAFVVAGGVIAVLGWLALWPSWEPGRLRREQRTALAAHARYADATLREIAGEGTPAATDAARRAAGVATNNLEASLARAFQEPRRSERRRIETAMVVDATLRRIAGRLSALRHDPAVREGLDAAGWQPWRDWIASALFAMSGGAAPAAPRPEGRPPEALSRIARQVELLEGALGQSSGRAQASAARVRQAVA